MTGERIFILLFMICLIGGCDSPDNSTSPDINVIQEPVPEELSEEEAKYGQIRRFCSKSS